MQCDAYKSASCPDGNMRNIINDKYRSLTGRELLGENLGQFNCDFKFDNNHINVHSVGFIGLGKKMYIHKLCGTHKDTGEVHYKYQYKMKGISKKALDYHVNKYYEGDMLRFYEHIYDGGEATIDMLCDDTVVSFDIKMGNITMRENFTRTIKVNASEEEVRPLTLNIIRT
jgi:hypothetical protein